MWHNDESVLTNYARDLDERHHDDFHDDPTTTRDLTAELLLTSPFPQINRHGNPASRPSSATRFGSPVVRSERPAKRTRFH